MTEQLPAGARCLTRLRDQVVHAVIDSGRAVDQVAASFGLAWWTVQSAVNTAAVTLPDPDMAPVRHLGVDEHRFRSARFFRDCDTDTWTRQ